jgi:hypothetical protein
MQTLTDIASGQATFSQASFKVPFRLIMRQVASAWAASIRTPTAWPRSQRGNHGRNDPDEMATLPPGSDPPDCVRTRVALEYTAAPRVVGPNSC